MINSLKFRLMALVVLGILPAVGIIFYGYVEQRQLFLTSATGRASDLISSVLNDWQFVVESTRRMLIDLAAQPGIDKPDRSTCEDILQHFFRKRPSTSYANVGVLDPNGNLICSLIESPSDVNVADRSYFQDAVRTRDFTVGRYQFGRLTNLASVNFGYPVLDDAGQVRAVVFAALDINWFKELINTAGFPSGATLTAIDHDGIVVARYPESAMWVGRRAPEREIARIALNGGHDAYEETGEDGVSRMYVFRRLNNVREAGAVYLGIPTGGVAAKAHDIFVRSLMALGVAGMAGLAAVWIFAHLFVMRGINALTTASQQLASGDLSARTNLDGYGGEIGELGRVFDHMAESLQHREMEARQAAENLLIFRSFVEASGQGMGIATPDGVITYLNPTLLSMGGAETLEQAKGRQILDYVPDDWRRKMTEEVIPALHAAGQWSGEMTFCSPEGQCRYTLLHEFFIRDEEGKPVHRAAVITDITERKETEERLRGALKFQSKLLSTSASGVFTLDLEGNLNMVNEEFCSLTGYQKEEIVGRHFSILGETTYLDTLDIFEEDSGHPTLRREGSILTKGGRTLSVLMNHSPLTNELGGVTGFIVSFVDVTELIEAREAAEKASRVKSEFLANMSHEVRTPINGIMGMTELTLNTQLTDEQRDYLEAVKVSSGSLLQIINDILDFSKMESGKLELVEIEFSLRDAVADTMSMLAYQAHKKGLELLYEVQEEVPDVLIGDPGRLRQVLVNLVGNAVKFTHKGEIALAVEIESEADNDIRLHFAVTDTGIGIAQEKQDRIFQAFEQADTSTTRRYGGTGLGLAVSKQLVTIMNGKIWIESEVGQGSTFHFTVDLRLPARPARSTSPLSQVDLTGIPVLVVDDNETNRRILDNTLRYWGMKPTLASGGPEALDALDRAYGSGQRFSLVITDCMMPEMDGFQLAERIQESPHLASPLIVMCPSSGERGDAARCVNLNIAAYLLKPIKQSELYFTICRILQQPWPIETQQTLITRHTIRESKRRLNILLAEDNPVNQKLAVKILERMGHTVTVAENGRIAVDSVTRISFDLVLMDVQMPEMDGLEATRAIREIEKTTHERVPIVAMTAYAMKGDREKCLEAGMDGYVSKPIDIKELSRTIDDLIAKNEAREEPILAGSPTGSIVNRDAFLERVGGDEQLMKQLIGLFLDEGPRLLAQVEEAVRQKAPEELEKAANALKDSVAGLAAEQAMTAAGRLEVIGKSRDLDHVGEAYQDLRLKVQQVRRELVGML